VAGRVGPTLEARVNTPQHRIISLGGSARIEAFDQLSDVCVALYDGHRTLRSLSLDTHDLRAAVLDLLNDLMDDPLPTDMVRPSNHEQLRNDQNTLMAGSYVIIKDGVADIADGQICRVLARDEEPNYRLGDYPEGMHLAHYDPSSGPCGVLVRCWTGFIAWTDFANLMPIEPTRDAAASALAALFVAGHARSGDMMIEF
jgi:hypothetical protein